MLKIKTGYYPKLLNPETIKLFGNGGNVPFLEITEVVLIHC